MISQPFPVHFDAFKNKVGLQNELIKTNQCGGQFDLFASVLGFLGNPSHFKFGFYPIKSKVG